MLNAAATAPVSAAVVIAVLFWGLSLGGSSALEVSKVYHEGLPLLNVHKIGFRAPVYVNGSWLRLSKHCPRMLGIPPG